MQQKEVFISYRAESAGETVRKVSAALEGAGVSCWYVPRDCDEQYAGSIVAGIRNCRVFQLILNEKSNLSAHVLNEINCAFDRFRNHEDITLLLFRIDNCTLSDDVYYYLVRAVSGAGLRPGQPPGPADPDKAAGSGIRVINQIGGIFYGDRKSMSVSEGRRDLFPGHGGGESAPGAAFRHGPSL